MDVTVAVATFGAVSWDDLARDRAVPSALDLEVPVVHIHGSALHEARNTALAKVATEYVIFLDADDELEHDYIDAMADGTADIRVPAVRYVDAHREQRPRMPRVAGHDHDCQPACLNEGNWLVIGCAARADLLRSVGGFHDYPVYEDYDLWLRCWLAGATIERHEDAVYRAHVRPDSRNRGSLTAREKHAVHQAIARANAVKVPA